MSQIKGVYHATAPTVRDGQNEDIQVDSAGNLKVATSGASTLSTLDHGAKSSVGTSAVQMTASSITASKGVLVKAANSNTGIVYVGNSDVTANTTDATDGFELVSGESVFIEVSNANLIYLRASASGQKVFFLTV